MVYVLEALFSGVIVGFETIEGFGETIVYVQGSVDDVARDFYILVDRETYNKLLALGIGVMISGRGRVLSEKPFIVEVIEINLS